MGYSYPYILLLMFYLLLFIIEQVNFSNITIRKSVRIISGLVFLFFFGFKGYLGSDWYNYEILYSLASWSSWSILDYEPGFAILTRVFKSIGFSYFEYVTFITAFQVLLFDKFISNYSKTIALPYILLIALFPILIVDLHRNFLSLLIVLNGVRYLENDQKRKFYFCVVLAMQFHLTAITFFILPLINRTYIKKRILIVLFVLGLIVYFLQINFFNNILLFIGSIFGGRIEYLMIQAAGENEFSYGLSFGIIEKITLLLLLILLYNKVKKILTPLILNACIIYVFIYLYFSTSQSFINRFSILFFWAYILTYCNLSISLMRNRIYSFITMILLFSFLRAFLSYNSLIYKYNNTFFQEEHYNNRLMDRKKYYENR